MLDLVELAIFVRTVDGRSLTAAATAMSLPRSTVTRRLAQLEDRLGVQLLQRTTRSMSLTAAGEAVCLGKGQGPLEWTLVHRREQVVVPLQPRLLVTHFQALRSAIAGGLGIGLMPTFYGDRAVNEGRVVPVLQEWSAEGASVHAVMPANRHPRPAVQRFVETVHRAMQMTDGLT